MPLKAYNSPFLAIDNIVMVKLVSTYLSTRSRFPSQSSPLDGLGVVGRSLFLLILVINLCCYQYLLLTLITDSLVLVLVLGHQTELPVKSC